MKHIYYNTIIANALKYLDEAELSSYVFNEFIRPMTRQFAPSLGFSEAFTINCYRIAVSVMNEILGEDYFELRVRDGHDLYMAAKHWDIPCGDYVYGKGC